jgi:uroporphyrinogen decarboxylase
MELTSYERLTTALGHGEPDPVPFDLGGTIVSGINIRALKALCVYLGLPGEPKIQDVVTQMAETGNDIAERLRVDVRNVIPHPVPTKNSIKGQITIAINLPVVTS